MGNEENAPLPYQTLFEIWLVGIDARKILEDRQFGFQLSKMENQINEATGPQNHERQDQIHNGLVDTRLTRARRFKMRQQPRNLGDEVSRPGLDKIGPFERFHDRQEREQLADPC